MKRPLGATGSEALAVIKKEVFDSKRVRYRPKCQSSRGCSTLSKGIKKIRVLKLSLVPLYPLSHSSGVDATRQA